MRIRIKKSTIVTLISGFFILIYPLMGLPLLLVALRKQKTYSKALALPFGLVFGSIGYNIYCKYKPDLVRYLAIIRNMEGMNLRQVIERDSDLLYTRDFLFFLVSKTKDEYILPFIVAVIVYSIVFYVLVDIIDYYELCKQKNGKLFAVLICLSSVGIVSPFSIIGNVRCVTAFVVIFFAVYRDMFQKKRNMLTVLLYVLPAWLHTAAIILLILRIVIVFLSWKKRKISKLMLLVIALFPTIVNLSYSLGTYLGNSLLKSMINKAYFYLNWTDGGFADVVMTYASVWLERLFGVPYVLLMICFAFKLASEQNTDISIKVMKMKEVLQFYYFVAIMALGCLWIKTGGFWRFEAIITLFCPLVLVPIIVKQNYEKNNVSILVQFALVGGAMMSFINVLLFFRWVHMDLFLSGFLETSPFYLIIKLITGIAS